MTAVPPIPASAAARPTTGGLVIPYINIRLADGGVDFRTPHNTAYQQVLADGLCQTCGQPLPPFAVLFGGPNQMRRLIFDEPPLCPPCALYASHACPMVAGRQPHYATRHTLAEGHRGKTCPTPGCPCGGFTPTDPSLNPHGGDPAHPWYACWVPREGWTLTGHQVQAPCSDGGCNRLHTRNLLNGAVLHTPPRKVYEVSTPGQGRTWRRLTPAEITALTADHHYPPQQEATCRVST